MFFVCFFQDKPKENCDPSVRYKPLDPIWPNLLIDMLEGDVQEQIYI